MAGLGHLRRFEHTSVTSAGTPKPTFACTATSDAVGQFRKSPLFIRALCRHKERFWDFEPERLGGFEIDNKVEFCRLLDRQVCWLGSSKYPYFTSALGDIADMAGPPPGLVPLENDPEATPFKFRVRDCTRTWQTPDQSGASSEKARHSFVRWATVSVVDDQNLGQELEADGRTAVRFSSVLAWLQSEAVRHKDTGRFLEEFADLVLQAGVALFRVTIGIHIIHPQIDASRTLWQKGKPVTERRWKMDRQVVQNSPMATIYGGRIFRVRLDGPPQPREFPILAELRAEA